MQDSVMIQSDCEQHVLERVFGGQAAVATYRSPTRETGNEDCIGILPFTESAGVLVVADGLGGERSGAMASRLAVEALGSAMEEGRNSDRDLRDIVLTGIELANQRVMELGTGAATTLAVAQVENGIVRTYHVGDSWIAVIGQRGKIKRQAIAHSPVGMALEAGVLSEDDAMHHEDRHIVSNVVGAPDMRVEMGAPIALAPRDTLILASDGVTDNLFLAELIESARKGSLTAALQRVVTAARERMALPTPGFPSKPDDLSIVLFRKQHAVRKLGQL